MLIKYTFSASLPQLESVLRTLEDELDIAVRRTAFKLQIEAVKILNEKVYNRRRAEGDYIPTGALRASLFAETFRGRNDPLVPTYAQAASEARRKAKKGKKAITISQKPPKPKKAEAWVGVAVNYGVYVEYPTRGRPGVYYLATSIINLRAYFRAEVAAAIERAKRAGP